jgi:hypothetical protein
LAFLDCFKDAHHGALFYIGVAKLAAIPGFSEYDYSI